MAACARDEPLYARGTRLAWPCLKQPDVVTGCIPFSMYTTSGTNPYYFQVFQSSCDWLYTCKCPEFREEGCEKAYLVYLRKKYRDAPKLPCFKTHPCISKLWDPKALGATLNRTNNNRDWKLSMYSQSCFKYQSDWSCRWKGAGWGWRRTHLHPENLPEYIFYARCAAFVFRSVKPIW